MEQILHIEPINRTPVPTSSLGHMDYLFYGECLDDEGENRGSMIDRIRLGAPLETPDGSDLPPVSLVKTVSYLANHFHDYRGEDVYAETLHYVQNNKILIPYRTKLHSSSGMSARLNHLPSLNYIRQSLVGSSVNIADPRSEIVTNLILSEDVRNPTNKPLREWIVQDLAMSLSKQPANLLCFNEVSQLTNRLMRYGEAIRTAPYELSSRSLQNIVKEIDPDVYVTPDDFLTNDPVRRPLLEFRNNLVPNAFDFRSLGQIPIGKLPRIEINHFEFKEYCDLIDRLPLTDVNVDFILTKDDDIGFYHEHVVLDRFGGLNEGSLSVYNSSYIVQDYFDAPTLKAILKKFVYCHGNIDDQIRDYLCDQPVKIKIIKTIQDEAAILLYEAHSKFDDLPLCGVYFDIALLSLAPLSIVEETVAN